MAAGHGVGPENRANWWAAVAGQVDPHDVAALSVAHDQPAPASTVDIEHVGREVANWSLVVAGIITAGIAVLYKNPTAIKFIQQGLDQAGQALQNLLSH